MRSFAAARSPSASIQPLQATKGVDHLVELVATRTRNDLRVGCVNKVIERTMHGSAGRWLRLLRLLQTLHATQENSGTHFVSRLACRPCCELLGGIDRAKVRTHVAARFSVDRIADAYIGLYQNLLRAQ